MRVTPGEARALLSWAQMLARSPAAVVAQWSDPWQFLRDMGERPEGMSLGRMNTRAEYGPGNCLWQTPTQKNRNTRRNVVINGKTQSQVALDIEMAQASVMRRRIAGVPMDSPRRYRGNRLTRAQAAAIKRRLLCPGSNSAIAREFGVSHTLIGMFRRGEIWAFVDPSEASN